MESDFEKILKEGDKISIFLIVHDNGLQPEIGVNITRKKPKESKTITFMPAKGVSGQLDLFNFNVGKKKSKFKFPFEVESMEISFPSIFKATLKKKESE